MSEPRHAAGRRRRPKSRYPVRRKDPLVTAGWAFLILALVLALVLGLFSVFGGKEEKPVNKPVNNVPGADLPPVARPTEAPAESHEYKGNGLKITAFLCDYTIPESVTISTIRTVDFSEAAPALIRNAAAMGWGECAWTTDASGLLLYRGTASTLTEEDMVKQKEFIASSRPEDMARTWVSDSGLITLLGNYGISVDTASAENKGGEIRFKGSGANGEACSIALDFFYTGILQQGRVTARYPGESATVTDIRSPKTAANDAKSWNSVGGGSVQASSIELRNISGIPFWVFGLTDGNSAYSLAVKESALEQVEGAAETYRSLMSSGIQEYIYVPGAGT